MDEPLSEISEKEKGELLNIDGNTIVGEPYTFGIGMHLSLFYDFVMIRICQQIFRRNRSRKRDIQT